MPVKKRKDTLTAYRRKRDFEKTPEPQAHPPAKAPEPVATPKIAKPTHRRVFVVQLHDARRLHYDFRLEVEGVLVSWAVPKGPSMEVHNKHLAVRTEDHPLEYAAFEGVIPEGNYGAGAVIVWDGGVYDNARHDKDGNEIPMSQSIEEGHVSVFLEGSKLRGGFALTRTSVVRGKENWILVKKRDAYADPGEDPARSQPESILSGKTIEQVAREGVIQEAPLKDFA